MITKDMIIEAQTALLNNWGEDGKKVIEVCAQIEPFNKPSKDFLEHCMACGGNWGGMFLTGVQKLYPEVWDAIPNNMGTRAFQCICSVLILCGVDTSEK